MPPTAIFRVTQNKNKKNKKAKASGRGHLRRTTVIYYFKRYNKEKST